MAALKKLQAEIDKTLKKVDEGLEEFQSLWENVQHATTSNQREKLEGELKSHIKKLQREREQIKGWLGDKQIKDKGSLGDARKKIEIEMERFKEFERESKTKAFSKEGLNKADKADPHEEEIKGHSKWIQEAIDELKMQNDGIETELEQASNLSKKKKSNAETARLESLKGVRDRHQTHIRRLEQLKRKVDNDEVDLTEIEDVQALVEIYVEQGASGDNDDETISASLSARYDSFNLDIATETMSIKETRSSIPENDPPPPAREGRGTKEKKKKEPVKEPSVGLPKSGPPVGAVNSPVSKLPVARQGSSETTRGPSTSVWQNPGTATSTEATRHNAPPPASSSHMNGTPSGSAAAPANPPSGDRSFPPPISLPPQGPPNIPPPLGPPSTTSSALGAASENKSSSFTPNSRGGPLQNTPSASAPSSSVPFRGFPSAPTGIPPLPATSATTPPPTGVPLAHLLLGLSPISFTNPAPSQAPPLPSGPPGAPPTAPPTGPPTLPPTAPPPTAPPTAPPNLPPNPPPTGPPAMPPTLPPTAPPQAPPNLPPPTPSQPLPSSASNPFVPAVPPIPPPQLPPPSLPPGSDMDACLPPSDPPPPPPMSSSVSYPPPPCLPPPPPSMEPTTTASSSTPHVPPRPSQPPPTKSLNRSDERDVLVSLVSEKTVKKKAHLVRILNLVTRSLWERPIASDSVMEKRFRPRNPYVHVDPYGNSFYPTEENTSYSHPRLFERYDLDTLFFIFYYQQGAYHQHLSAKELKKLSWRFHTKYLTWFQRKEDPRVATTDYERGAYVYFDYDAGWCQRMKTDFTFEYRYLEEDKS